VGLSLAVAIAIITATGIPITNWDSFVIWSMKARIMAAYPLTPRPEYFSNVSASFSHLDYPLLLSMLLAGAYAAMGQFNEQWAKIVLPVLFCGQIMLLYTGARLWLGRLAALMVTLLLIGAPVILSQASICNAEMALATFRLGSVVYLVRWTMRGERADVILCALFTVLAANTKNEGLALAAVTTVVLLGLAMLKFRGGAGGKAWCDAAVFVTIVSIGVGVWVAWRAGLPHTDENYPSRLSPAILAANLSRLGVIFQGFGFAMGYRAYWGVLWLLIPILAVLGWRGFAQIPVLALWGILLLHLGLYALMYVITPWDVMALMRDSLHRLLIHVAPTAALLVAAHWAATAGPTPFLFQRQREPNSLLRLPDRLA
jgi:hypothetical protein